jgi:hypothetical protein
MTLDDMEKVLKSLGIEPLGTSGCEIRALCPGHLERTGKEDRRPSWFINADTGAHICFSCHFKGSLMYLVGYINKLYSPDGTMDFDQAKDWLGTKGSLSSALDRAVTINVDVQDTNFVEEEWLAAFSAPPAYALTSRGLSPIAAECYEVLWNKQKDSWVLPVRRGANGELLGWQEKGFTGRYFNNYPAGMKKSESVFGLQNYSSGDLIVVESPLDAVRLASLNINTGVAIYGSFISKQQINLIKPADRLIFAFDNDLAGIEASKNIIKVLQDLWFDAWFFNYDKTDQKDIGGMSRTEIEYGLQNARHCTTQSQLFTV